MFQIKKNSVDISGHILKYERNQSFCEGTGFLSFAVALESGLSFQTWDTILLFEGGIKKGTYNVASIAKDAKLGTIVVDCQDNSKRMTDYFIDETYTSEGVTNCKYWIETFLDLAGVSYNFISSGNGSPVKDQQTYGFTDVYSTIVELCQQSGWHMYFNANGVLQVGKILKSGNSDCTLVDNEIVNINSNKNDRMLRNRAVVWGNTEPDGTQIFVDISVDTPWNYDTDDKRAVVLASSGINTQAEALKNAKMMLDEFKQITLEITATVAGVADIEIADTAYVNSNYYVGTALVTTLSSVWDDNGLITSVILGQRCPRLVASVSEGSYPGTEDGTPILVGTWGSGVYGKPINATSWTQYSNGILTADRYIKDLDVAMGNAAVVSSTGKGYYASNVNSLSIYWYKLVGTIKDVADNEYSIDELDAVACSVNSITGEIFFGYNHKTERLSWVISLYPGSSEIKYIQVKYGDVYDITIYDISNEYGELYVSIETEIFVMDRTVFKLFRFQRVENEYRTLTDLFPPNDQQYWNWQTRDAPYYYGYEDAVAQSGIYAYTFTNRIDWAGNLEDARYMARLNLETQEIDTIVSPWYEGEWAGYGYMWNAHLIEHNVLLSFVATGQYVTTAYEDNREWHDIVKFDFNTMEAEIVAHHVVYINWDNAWDYSWDPTLSIASDGSRCISIDFIMSDGDSYYDDFGHYLFCYNYDHPERTEWVKIYKIYEDIYPYLNHPPAIVANHGSTTIWNFYDNGPSICNGRFYFHSFFEVWFDEDSDDYENNVHCFIMVTQYNPAIEYGTRFKSTMIQISEFTKQWDEDIFLYYWAGEDSTDTVYFSGGYMRINWDDCEGDMNCFDEGSITSYGTLSLWEVLLDWDIPMYYKTAHGTYKIYVSSGYNRYIYKVPGSYAVSPSAYYNLYYSYRFIDDHQSISGGYYMYYPPEDIGSGAPYPYSNFLREKVIRESFSGAEIINADYIPWSDGKGGYLSSIGLTPCGNIASLFARYRKAVTPYSVTSQEFFLVYADPYVPYEPIDKYKLLKYSNGGFNSLFSTLQPLKIDNSKGTPLVLYGDRLYTKKSGEGWHDISLAGGSEIDSARCYDIISQAEEGYLIRRLAVTQNPTTSGNISIISTYSIDANTEIEDFSPLVTVSGKINAIEFSNNGYLATPHMFYAVSGHPSSFHQRLQDEDTWNNYSSGLPSSHITVIRVDEIV